MLGLYPRQQARSDDDVSSDHDGEDELVGGYNVFYGIAVVCLSIFLFCVLAASVNVWKSLAFAALAALLLSVAGCFAPARWFRRRRRSSSTADELVVTATSRTARPRAPIGYAMAALVTNAPPAFAFECPAVKAGGGSDGNEPCCCVVCSVCLEDVRGGEMVRQVPACRHVFHVECIDMWLHSHRTCPMCRCMISPPLPSPKGSSPAAEEAPHQSSTEELPPV
ncbi:hypothetical protein PR202_ga07056 [Eleusine coracana subsp. coracana]|uniref:RING-type E3 ubiquitin transferase n=1 Tax=Eleusine coracana subsp. coracana TaxID=191504 RepID=A0AAV5BYZ1_ELECO|nr:hypothetical protein QOZ80_2AG0107840 [Eleusine coracana subsp. coracana]GJM90747.1 hypothetical protein PR202_ga07056 [Eleusine coracana subsp. coracana]